jgi:hypothetical protein
MMQDDSKMSHEQPGSEEAQSNEESTSTAVAPFIGQWNQLVSHTNWEKGRIICDWRAAIEAAGAPANECSDEAWSRIVGNVTPQHVGRLRRVYQRFQSNYEQFGGLYWSHFFAALDWVDAEMWLEGASQNAWSVSETRRMRQETLGAVATGSDEESDGTDSEIDEDFSEDDQESVVSESDSVGISRGAGSHEDAIATEESDEEDGEEERDVYGEDSTRGREKDGSQDSREANVRPFADMPELPDDLADAFDSFKLAILAHKTTGWDDVSPDQVLASLDALKKLVGAP